MRGMYKIYLDGKLVNEAPNLITNAGRPLVLRYLAGQTSSIGGSISCGTSGTAASAADVKLGLEFMRGAVLLRGVDYTTNRVIFKATMDPAAAGVIYELGLYPYQINNAAQYGGESFTNFDSSNEPLTGGTANTINFRTSNQSYSVSPALSTSATISLSPIYDDLSGYQDADIFTLGYFINDANTATINIRIKTDAANYYQFSFAPPTVSGYYVRDILKSSFTVVGTPTWANISSLDFIVTAQAAGATTVQLDAFRLNDTDIYQDYGLVSRSVLATPQPKLAGEQMDIEYLLEFNI